MPREHVTASHVTVRAGDLPVMAARDRRDLDRLVLPAPDGSRPIVPLTVGELFDYSRLRRRHDLLLALVNELTTTHRDDLSAPLDRLVTDLRLELERLPLDVEADEGGDLHPTGPGVRRTYRTRASGTPTAEARDAADAADEESTVRLRLRATVGWEPGGGDVTLSLGGWAPDGLAAVDLGGLAVPLDRRACNRLRELLRRASDEANGELA